MTYRLVKQRDGFSGLILAFCIIALGSNLLVSFILAANPYYFTSGAYSTIIRYSDSGIPAFFLAAPFAISAITKNRKGLVGLVLVLLLTVAVAVPLYPRLASSNFSLTQEVNGDPFLPGFRTPSVMIRDYVLANPDLGPFMIIGAPTYYGFTDVWNFTPGTQGLPVHFVRSISSQSFLEDRWSVFYVYGDSGDNASLFDRYPFSGLLPSRVGSNLSLPFQVVDRQVIFNQTAFLIRFQLAWS